ncbi:hypothetical protein ABIF99_008711 [Bradyrhizobium japonicum]
MTRKSESKSRAGAYASSVGAALLLAAGLGVEVAQAQAIMRTPTISVPTRTPTISPSIAARVSPGVGARAVGVTPGPRSIPAIPRTTTTARMRPTPVLPYARYSPNLYPACTAPYRDADGECLAQPGAGGDGAGKSGKKRAGKGLGDSTPAAVDLRTFANEFVAEIDGALSATEADELARRHGLTRVSSENFPLIGATFGLFRITDGRPSETVRREFAADGSVRSVQPNFRYVLQDQKSSVPTEGDPAQYVLARLRLPQAHTLAHGANVTVAVIDSGIDAQHPELAHSIADNFDALGSSEGPHVHGTGIAGAIVAHAKLMGSAPEARIIAIRAFGGSTGGAQSSSYIVLRSLNYAAEHGAQIVNMSFAGPKDAVIERAIAAAAARGAGADRGRGQCRREIAAALSGRQSQRDRGQRDRPAGQAVLGVQPRQLHRAGGARRRHLPARAGRQVPDDLGDLVLGRLCLGRRRVAARAQLHAQAGSVAHDAGEDRARPRFTRP